MSRMTFINLPVKDLRRASGFFTDLGFSFDPQFSDEATACMVISGETFAMLHVEPRFEEFAQQHATDTAASREVIVGLSAASRGEVDDLAAAAVASGGQALGGPVEDGPMYMRAFRDLDGHQWSTIHMDTSAAEA